MKIAGFNWDEGNWPKCGKHGVSKEEIEQLFTHEFGIFPDPYSGESRIRGIGKIGVERYLFLVFMLRMIDGEMYIRPISARFMHKKEIENYEARTEDDAATTK